MKQIFNSQVLNGMMIGSGLLVAQLTPVFAAEPPPASHCFNFDTLIKEPLRKAPELNPKKDATASGKLPAPKGGFWGLARGIVNKPIGKLYEQLLDHYTIKSPEKVKLKVYPQDRDGYQDFHLVMVSAHTPIMDIKWEEDWGYVIKEGTKQEPKSIVISYQKTAGTKFIPHLCGSIVLNSKGPNSTDVYLYEEIDALGKRSHQETVSGHVGTLNTLRAGPKLSDSR
jgi:hypothetical protein